MSRVWSEQQSTVLTAVAEAVHNMLIRSVAGSGKTSVIIEAAQFVPRNSIFLAFNKKIVEELKGRLPANCQANTFHALCLHFLKERLPRGLKVNGYKSHNLVDKMFPDLKEAKWDIARLVGLMKNHGVGIFEPATKGVAEYLREEYDITNEEVLNEDICAAAVKILKQNEKDLMQIDFDDMLYLTLKFIKERGWNMVQYPVVFIDEAQDTNRVQLALLEAMAKRVIAVGDDAQAIYGFRGAGTGSMDDIKQMFDCTEYDMSISWRCPQSVAELARARVPNFEAAPNAIEGEVLYVNESIMMENLRPEDLVLCRQNFPLFKVALKLLKGKIPFNMTGKFPEQLIKFVKSFKAQNLQEFRIKLMAWWKEKKEELTSKKKFSALEREEDKYESLMELQRSSTSVMNMLDNLEAMITSKSGIKLSTIHGAKGLEARVVVFLKPELIPSKYAITPDQIEQEMNLRYVAETRAKERLIHVFGEERNG